MPRSQFAIPARTIAAGQTTFGPFTPGAGFNACQITLDITNLTPTLRVRMEYAVDGVTYVPISDSGYVSGPGWNKYATPPAIDPNLNFSADIGNNAAGPNLTTNKSTFRLIVDNTTAFASSGGSVTLT
jgi:hypothetical protein